MVLQQQPSQEVVGWGQLGKGVESGCILKGEASGHAAGLDLRHVRKRAEMKPRVWVP